MLLHKCPPVFGNQEVRGTTHNIIASMTKAITCVAIMQLIEHGKIHLDDAASKYVAKINNLMVIDHFNRNDTSFTTRAVSHPITIINLLTHASGLGYPFSNSTLAMINQKINKGQIFSSYADFPLLVDPGVIWTYGFSFDILGKIIENASGSALDKYFYQNIFKPLGMINTYFEVPEEKHIMLSNFYMHVNDQFIEQESPGKQKPTEFNGGGGLYSTAEDYTIFLQTLLNNGTFKGVKDIKQKICRRHDQKSNRKFIRRKAGRRYAHVC